MSLKTVKKNNPIGATKTSTKHNFSLFMEEGLTILKEIHGKHITVMNKNT